MLLASIYNPLKVQSFSGCQQEDAVLVAMAVGKHLHGQFDHPFMERMSAADMLHIQSMPCMI